ncbi:MAG TPA: type II secretion system protein N [Casimicrobiaceae bacterium]
MRSLLRFVVGVVLLVAAGIALMPAASLDRPLAARTQDRVRLADAKGPWWRGEGVLVTADGSARLPVAWRLALVPLLTGTVVIDLQPGSDNSMPSGTITLRHGTLGVRDLHLRAPAALAAAFVPALKTVALGGNVDVQSSAFSFHEGVGVGVFDATWQGARIVAGQLALDLGIVSVSAVPKGDAQSGIIRNTGGDVAIDGTIDDQAGVVEVALLLKPTASASSAVRAMLPLLGIGDGAGSVRVTWRSNR